MAGREAGDNPWSAGELMEPAELAGDLQSGKQSVILCVGFAMLYRQKHIVHAELAGPSSKPEGVDRLNEAVAKVPQSSKIVIYCGCCPMVHCPNLRPGFEELKRLGYSNVRVLNLPTNFRTDWVEKGYPVESSLK